MKDEQQEELCVRVEEWLATGLDEEPGFAAHVDECEACGAAARGFEGVRRAYHVAGADDGGAALHVRVLAEARAATEETLGASSGAAVRGGEVELDNVPISAATEAAILDAARAELGPRGAGRMLAWTGSLAAAALLVAFGLWYAGRGDEARRAGPDFATATEALFEAGEIAWDEPHMALAIYKGVFARIDWDAADADLGSAFGTEPRVSPALREDLAAAGYLDGGAGTLGSAPSAELADMAAPIEVTIGQEPTWFEIARALEAAAYLHVFALDDLAGGVVLMHRLTFDYPEYGGHERALTAEARWLALLGENGAALETLAELPGELPEDLMELRQKLMAGLQAEVADLGYADGRTQLGPPRRIGPELEATLQDLGYMGYL